jgi:hypothetical protein
MGKRKANKYSTPLLTKERLQGQRASEEIVAQLELSVKLPARVQENIEHVVLVWPDEFSRLHIFVSFKHCDEIISEPWIDFPSEEFIARIMLLAG